MKSLSLAVLILLSVSAWAATEKDFNGLENAMDPETYERAGLGKLSKDERAVLDQFIRDYVAGKQKVAATRAAEAAVNKAIEEHKVETPQVVESRIVGTRNQLEGVRASSTEPSVFVGQSAIGYYGDRGDEILDEESPPGEGFAAEVPVDWEAAERAAEDVFDRVVILRTGLVLTRDGGLVKQLLLPFKLGVGGPIAGGDQ